MASMDIRLSTTPEEILCPMSNMDTVDYPRNILILEWSEKSGVSPELEGRVF